MNERTIELRKLKEWVKSSGGEDRIRKQHELGKLTARERLDLLLDSGSFVELDMLAESSRGWPADGLVAGFGTIEGRPVSVYSEDFTVLGGSQGAVHGYKMYKTIERALELGIPFIGLHDGVGARVMRPDKGEAWDASQSGQEKGIAPIFYINTQASGVVPQLSAILGPCAGGSVYSPALNDFIFMVDGISQMFITGPPIVRSVMSEDISKEELGGAKVHARISGVCDFRSESEEVCFRKIRKLLSFLPPNNSEMPPMTETGDDPERRDESLAAIVPDNPAKVYDMRKVIGRLVDNGDFLEVKEEFAPNIVVGFGRLGGWPVGFVANQPMVLAGSMSADSSVKQARFTRFCDCFNVPIVLLVDTSGYMPGRKQEYGAIIRHGAKVLHANTEATVPKIAVVLRKSYGGANQGMAVTSGLGTDFTLAWPTAEIAAMGAEQSLQLFFPDEIRAAPSPEEFIKEKVKWYREQYADVVQMASRSTVIHDVIEPQDTRWYLIKLLGILRNRKRVLRYTKKHGNIPL